ncbi:hypothetical protein JL721_4193 [Aureococcus anophagefferens]|nr:hypothetical protein JL721_4193 [Aureococcus anophagefferens]
MDQLELRSVVLGAVERYDGDGTGSIHASLFLQAIEGLGLKYGMRVVDDIMCECAISEEGYVDYREFRDAVSAEGREAALAELEPRQPAPRSAKKMSHGYVDAPVRPFQAHAATVEAEHQQRVAREKRRELQVVFERYSRGFSDDAGLKAELRDLGLQVTADLDAALAKARGGNDLVFHKFYRACVRDHAAAGGRRPQTYAEVDEDVVEEFMSFYGARKRTNPARNASIFGRSLALQGQSLEDELLGELPRDEGMGADGSPKKSLTGRKLFGSRSRELQGSSQAWSYKDGEVKRKETSTDARFATATKVAMRAGLGEPEVVGIRNSEQALQRQQIYAAVRKFGHGDMSARAFQDRMFAMGVEIPPAVLKLLTDCEASGEANLSKFVSAFERYFDARQRDLGINAVDVDTELASKVLAALRRKGAHGLRALFLGLGRVATLPLDGDAHDAEPAVDFALFCSALDAHASPATLDLPERRAFFARFDMMKNGMLSPTQLKFDRVGDGLADANEVRRAFDAHKHPSCWTASPTRRRSGRTSAFYLPANRHGAITADDWEAYYCQVSAALGPGDVSFLRWVKGPWRVPDAPPAPKEFCRRGLRGGAKNSDDPTFAVPKPMSGQCHGDIVAWNQEKSHLERRDDAHAVKRGQSRVERQNFHFARDFGKVSLDEAVSEMDQQFGVKRSSALTLAHAAGEGGILKWYAPRDESERLAASAPPPPVPRADVSGAAGGGSGTFSAHPLELRERAQHPQQAANWNRGCPYERTRNRPRRRRSRARRP